MDLNLAIAINPLWKIQRGILTVIIFLLIAFLGETRGVMRLPLVLLSCGFGAFLWAADFVVQSGQTVTTTQELDTAGDEGLIEQGGGD